MTLARGSVGTDDALSTTKEGKFIGGSDPENPVVLLHSQHEVLSFLFVDRLIHRWNLKLAPQEISCMCPTPDGLSLLVFGKTFYCRLYTMHSTTYDELTAPQELYDAESRRIVTVDGDAESAIHIQPVTRAFFVDEHTRVIITDRLILFV
jgi:hypothetical protein